MGGIEESAMAKASAPMTLPWEWIVEKLVDNKDIGTELLKGTPKFYNLRKSLVQYSLTQKFNIGDFAPFYSYDSQAHSRHQQFFLQ
jgi:hypothetical protein